MIWVMTWVGWVLSKALPDQLGNIRDNSQKKMIQQEGIEDNILLTWYKHYCLFINTL